LRGKIVLENVQLDGELIGSHVMGAFGLTGFGVLSCSAKTIHVSVPWKNIEREPTRFEVRGVHLVCVPLTPSTAHKLYGAGSRTDPRCSLRTRAKRLILARLERNYWNGQIPGEGPPMKRITRAVREVERDLRRSRINRKKQQQEAGKSARSSMGSNSSQEDAEMEEAFDNIIFGLNDSVNPSPRVATEGEDRSGNADAAFSPDDLPEIPRDWKVRLREKVLRNMEASIHEIHIRLEVPEGGLDHVSRLARGGGGGNDHLSSEKLKIFFSREDKAIDGHAFAVGFTLDSFVMRTANEQWEAGSHDKRNPVDGSAMSSVKGQLGPNPYVVKNNKIGLFAGFSIYWDNAPPLLLAETDVLQGNYRKLSSDKLLSRVAGAMDALFDSQEPGKAIRQTLGETGHRYEFDAAC
jgi:Vacuolar sorting-associated protein 13, N-terminal/N-terminal region of Chorein or VPS13